MAGRQDIRRFVRRIQELRSAFLPAPDPTGNYSKPDYYRTAAFLLLAHAEVEEFLEQRCLEVASAAVAAWTVDSVPRSTIVALAAFSHAKGKAALPKPGQTGRPQIREVLDSAKRSYSLVVHKNNGVKEENLLNLLLPLGIRESQIPTDFLNAMNTLGSIRGGYAHRRVGAQTPPDPVDSMKLTTRVVCGLWRLDDHLLRLKNE